jgi:hypothetical protein
VVRRNGRTPGAVGVAYPWRREEPGSGQLTQPYRSIEATASRPMPASVHARDWTIHGRTGAPARYSAFCQARIRTASAN